jgi:hypothetical protein
MNNFKTVSSPKKNLETIAMTFAVAVVLAAYGLTVTVAFWIFLEVLLLTVFAIMFFMVKKTYWVIEFHGTALVLHNNGNGQTYRIDELERSSFILKQTETQKKNNVGDVKFRDYPFLLNGVQDFKEFETYIKNNFQ